MNRPNTALPLAFVDDLEMPELLQEDRHHLGKVLRLKYGDLVSVSDGKGSWRECVFKKELEAAGKIFFQEPAELKIGVGFALLKGGRTELVVAKLTEVGADFMAPFMSEHSVAKVEDSKLEKYLDRWKKVAKEAAAQCRRVWLPKIFEPRDFLEAAAAAGPGTARCDMEGEPPSLSFPYLWVGPEGGWSESEREAMGDMVCLGPNVLRSETAAIVAGASLAGLRQGLFGTSNKI